MNVTNDAFLTALFGPAAHRVHVTAFAYDPANIPDGEHLRAWAGGWYGQQAPLPTGTNQYFTISLFRPDEAGKARRRKALFECTPVIVLDDVKEKLSVEQAKLLPKPTWILETSPGSEQWGYLLGTPCYERGRVENLLDGLVANGLAPEGKDPGMKGVTRYVRLPEGHNFKESKMLFGAPWKCAMRRWEPNHRVLMEDLALPFFVDLDAPRREARVDGADDLPDHPLITSGLLHIKEVRGPGRYDITCPWVHEHTGGADDGAGCFTNKDGSLGFKCHHGACEGRTGRDLMVWMENQQPGWREKLAAWQATKAFEAIQQTTGKLVPPPAVSFLDAPAAPQEPAPDSELDGVQKLVNVIRQHHPNSPEAKRAAEAALQSVEELAAIDQIAWHNQIRDLLGWNKSDFNRVLRELRTQWFSQHQKDQHFYDDVLFVKELNQFYNWKTRSFLTVEGFTNGFLHEDAEVRKVALQNGRVRKVDRLDYMPGAPRIVQEGNVSLGNMYYGDLHPVGKPGDATPWLNHWDAMGWGGAIKKHMLQFMAYTLLHPERKINHMILLGSREGGGKDFLLYPLLQAMGEDARVIEGDALVENYTGYLNGVKYLHVNETELGGRKEALQIANKLKPIAAAPPTTLRVREMFTKAFYIRNLVNCTMTTNSRLPLRLKESRRFYAVWSDITTRGDDGEVRKEWREYWERLWGWMKEGGGLGACIWYLRNQVDLSDFKPGAPPPMTDFLRDIQEDSKSPMQKLLEQCLQERVGAFGWDIALQEDLLNALREYTLMSPGHSPKTDQFSAQIMSLVLREIGIRRIMIRIDGKQVRGWCLRQWEKYSLMPQSVVGDAYLLRKNGPRLATNNGDFTNRKVDND